MGAVVAVPMAIVQRRRLTTRCSGLASLAAELGIVRQREEPIVFMMQSRAIRMAQQYAEAWGVPWHKVAGVEKPRLLPFLPPYRYDLEIDTGDGRATAMISTPGRYLYSFEYLPDSPSTFLLPLWAAYPTFNSVTSGWRQSYGEVYKHRWHAWYRSRSAEERQRYRERFPEPDDERLWRGFYEEIAAVPAGTGEPMIDFLINRV